MGAAVTTEFDPEAEVVLNVYSLGNDSKIRFMNTMLHAVGTGAFHCGVQVFGQEWSFTGTGVFASTPQQCPEHTYWQSVGMGRTYLTSNQVLRLLDVMRNTWQGKEYDVLTHNCCHFCDELCMHLGVGPIPGWTTSLADTGAAFEYMGAATGSALVGAPGFIGYAFNGVGDTFDGLISGCLNGRSDKTE